MVLSPLFKKQPTEIFLGAMLRNLGSAENVCSSLPPATILVVSIGAHRRRHQQQLTRRWNGCFVSVVLDQLPDGCLHDSSEAVKLQAIQLPELGALEQLRVLELNATQP